MPTCFRKCNCMSSFQDSEYGNGTRVQNLCKKTGPNYTASCCTVCGKQANLATMEKVTEKETPKRKKGKK